MAKAMSKLRPPSSFSGPPGMSTPFLSPTIDFICRTRSLDAAHLLLLVVGSGGF